MKTIRIAIFSLAFLPALCRAALQSSDSQLEVEKQVINTVKNLESLASEEGYFSWDDYVLAASSIVNRALEKYPSSIILNKLSQDITFRTLVRLEDIGLKQEKKDSLVNYFKNLYEKNRKSPSYIYLYARVLDNDSARLNLAEEIIKADPKSYWGYHLKGVALLVFKRYDEAQKCFMKAIEMDSTLYEAYVGLATLYFNTERYEEIPKIAIKVYEIAPHPDFAETPYYYAQRAQANIEDKKLLAKLDVLASRKITSQEYSLLEHRFARVEAAYYAFRESSQPDSARRYLDIMSALYFLYDPEEQNWVDFTRVCFEASQGENESALKLLTNLVDRGFSSYGQVDDEPDLALLKDNPDMIALKVRMKEKAKEDALKEKTSTPAPDFSLVTTAGDSVKLSNLRGKVVILDFWGVGCEPCYNLMPVIERFYKAHKAQAHVFGIENWGNSAEDISALLKEREITYPSLLGSPEVSKAYGVRAIPYLLVIDPKGKIVFSHLGSARGEGNAQAMYDKMEWWLEAAK